MEKRIIPLWESSRLVRHFLFVYNVVQEVMYRIVICQGSCNVLCMFGMVAIAFRHSFFTPTYHYAYVITVFHQIDGYYLVFPVFYGNRLWSTSMKQGIGKHSDICTTAEGLEQCHTAFLQ